MSVSIIHTRALVGLDAPSVQVEVHLSPGAPGLYMVGLPETVVKESKDRVRSAIINSGFKWPYDKRIVVNLAPADLPKQGGRFDLPIAIGILAASQQIKSGMLNSQEFFGELALDGAIRAVPGLLSAAIASNRTLVIPLDNQYCPFPKQSMVLAADHLNQVAQWLNEISHLSSCNASLTLDHPSYPFDMSDIKGQLVPKRALEIAACGGHNLLMSGSPGTGKTMLAQRLTSILPLMEEHEALEVQTIASINGDPLKQSTVLRPFRAPHHNASSVALVGGGSIPKPGEITKAHCGILFLDELPEFDRKVVEALREPLENGTISISRANAQMTFPAQFQLIAAMNPCPCGYLLDPVHTCSCSPMSITRYQNKLSGPLLDRIDLHIQIAPMSIDEITALPQGEASEVIRQRVSDGRNLQLKRQGKSNHLLTSPEIEHYFDITSGARKLLELAVSKFGLSMRGYYKALKVAQTIADLDDSDAIHDKHVAEAVQYRHERFRSSLADRV